MYVICIVRNVQMGKEKFENFYLFFLLNKSNQFVKIIEKIVKIFVLFIRVEFLYVLVYISYYVHIYFKENKMRSPAEELGLKMCTATFLSLRHQIEKVF